MQYKNVRYEIKQFIYIRKNRRSEIYKLLHHNFKNDLSFKLFNPLLPYTYVIQLLYNNKLIGISCVIPINTLIEKFALVYPNTSYPLPIITLNGVYMNNLCIDIPYRKLGLSKYLVKLTVNFTKNNDLDHILCQVDINNIRAIRLYNNFKFRIHSSGISNGRKCNIMYYVIS